MKLSRKYIFIGLLIVSLSVNLFLVLHKFNFKQSGAVHAPARSKQVAINYKSSKFPTFKEWLAVMQQLPTYYSLAAQKDMAVLNGDFNSGTNYKYSAFAANPKLIINNNPGTNSNPCDFTELSSALQAYFSLENTGALSQANNWVNNSLPAASFFDPAQAYFLTPAAPFLPFAQKLNLPVGSTVILRADIHGDGISFVRQIYELQKQGYMDTNDGFKLKDRNTYMLFLGDYADRGLYGAEIMYTVLRLKLANPDQVFMARGNHEDINMAKKEGFMTELQTKFGPLDFSAVYRVYEYLPAVIYLGSNHDYYQCCHGGLELGYDPTNLLNSIESIKFELLGKLKQLDFLEAHPEVGSKFKISDSSCECDNIACDECEYAVGIDTYPNIFNNFTPTAPVGLNGQLIGFMQHDFLVDDVTNDVINNLIADKHNSKSATAEKSHITLSEMGLGSVTSVIGEESVFVGYLKNQRMLCSKNFTKLVLDALSGETNKIHAVIRGHQHGADPKNHMMAGMIRNYGIFSLWPKNLDAKQNQTRKMSDYLVHTFLVAPDNIYGVSNKFNFDTFAILKLVNYATDELHIQNTTVSTVPPVIPANPAKKAKVKSSKAKS